MVAFFFNRQKNTNPEEVSLTSSVEMFLVLFISSCSSFYSLVYD